jgi:hypothetical protein
MSISGIEMRSGIQESLEQQSVSDWIDVGYPETVGYQRAGRRPAARPDRHPLLARIVDEVPHHQEVAGEAHLLDDGQLVREASLDRVARTVPVVALETLAGEILEVALQRVALGTT